MESFNTYHELLTNLHHTDVVLTPNRRLANHLQTISNETKIADDAKTWQPASILPFNTWLLQLWQQYSASTLESTPLLLNSSQENFVWEAILTASDYQHYFLRLSETIKLVKSAYTLLSGWQVNINDSAFDTTEDYRALKTWVTQFRKELTIKNWMVQADLANHIANNIEACLSHSIGCIYLVGFNDFSPQINRLLDQVTTRGVATQTIRANLSPEEILRTSAMDNQDEQLCMARWAKKIADTHPDDKIACVIPNLDAERDRVAHIFTHVFGKSEHVNISAGKNLSSYPVIQTALKLLRLHQANITNEQFYDLLTNAFIAGSEKEYLSRSSFDSLLRTKNITQVNYQDLCDDKKSDLDFTKRCPILADRLIKLKGLLEERPKNASYRYWSHFFNNMLSTIGWPGERILSSDEYQVVEEWLSLLKDLTSLDQTNEQVSYTSAFYALNQIAQSKPFQVQSPESNVQVLGILEAAGLQFDHLWVSGLNDQVWPAQPKPNPFIPKQLQRELEMPHASAERELTYCQTMTDTFISSAKHIIFSHACKNAESTLEASPLIKQFNYSPISYLPLADYEPAEYIIHQSKKLEYVYDAKGPSLDDNAHSPGGVDVLKTQALCPFKAFAQYRLNVRELDKATPGIRATDRGNIIHDILDKVWKHVHSHTNLVNLADHALSELISNITTDVLKQRIRYRPADSTYIQLENKRLQQLIFNWLTLEKMRAPFKIYEQESKHDICVGPIKLSVRVDRVDELEDGSKVVIDYKTGTNHKVSSWFGQRPDEPQLPLYAQLDSNEIIAISFAQVAPGNHTFKGISKHPVEIQGIKPIETLRQLDDPNWEKQVNDWQATLAALGNQFYEGEASVDPKDKDQTCLWCQLKPFCRINEVMDTQHAS